MKCLHDEHVSFPMSNSLSTHSATTHCALDPLREEESLVDCVDGVIALDVTLPLQQDGPGVQSVVGPEHREPALLVPMDQRPVSLETTGVKDVGTARPPDPMTVAGLTS